jgi:hypothetical protein
LQLFRTLRVERHIQVSAELCELSGQINDGLFGTAESFNLEQLGIPLVLGVAAVNDQVFSRGWRLALIGVALDGLLEQKAPGTKKTHPALAQAPAV